MTLDVDDASSADPTLPSDTRGFQVPSESDTEGFQVPSDTGGFHVVDFNAPPRDRPLVHPAVEAPMCPVCADLEPAFCDPTCPACLEALMSADTSIPQILAVLRQWSPQTQHNLELLIKEVLKRGGHVDDRDGLTDMSLLSLACRAGAAGVGEVEESCRMVSFLLGKGASLYGRCRWTDMTALHNAVFYDIAPCVNILLTASKAADVDGRSSAFDGGTCLHIAAGNLCEESVTVLLRHGADVTIKDDLARLAADCIPDSSDPDSEAGSSARRLKRLLEPSHNVTHSPLNLDGVSAKVTLTALGLGIGDKVIVGGVKSGILRYAGPTQFAPGIWAGIELDEPVGKNDGTVAGVGYFKCPQKHGIFAPISKIEHPERTRRDMAAKELLRIDHGRIETSHVTSRIDTGLSSKSRKNSGAPGVSSSRPSLGASAAEADSGQLQPGDRVLVAGQRRGRIRYGGETDFAPGWWYGIELDRPVGKNDGTVNGKRYFTCKPKCGVFAPPSRVKKLDNSVEELRMPNPGKTDKVSPSSEIGRSSGSSSSSRHGRTVSAPGAFSSNTAEFKLTEGMSVFCHNELGTLRYIGNVEFAEGTWLGVELRSAHGKNDGSVQGSRYFTCKAGHGLLVRPSKVTVRGINGAKLLGDTSPTTASDKS